MAVLNKQMILDAGRDATDLGLVVCGPADLNGDGMVDTRFGGEVKTVRRQLQDIVAAPPQGWIDAFAGSELRGQDAPDPQSVVFTLSANQTRIPAVGNFDGFDYGTGNSLVILINGIAIDPQNYTAPGDTAAITLSGSFPEGTRARLISNLSLGSGAAAGAGTAINLAASKYRTALDMDDELALERIRDDAARATNRVYLKQGKGLGENGRYLIGTQTQNASGFANNAGNLWSGLELFGDGMGLTVVEQMNVAYGFYFNPPGPLRVEVGNGLNGLYIHDLTIFRPAGLPFDEYNCQMMLNGARNVTLERIHFLGATGDGLHLGQGDVPGQVRFNENIKGRDLFFNGHPIANRVGGNNRNAISILSGVNIDIEAVIRDFTRRGGAGGTVDPFDPYTGLPMPAGADVEPNFGGDKLYLGNIRLKLDVDRCGGGAAALFLPGTDDSVSKARNIRIEVTARNCYRGKITAYGYAQNVTPYDIEIIGNDYDCYRPFEVIRTNGLTIRGKSRNFDLPGLMGYPDGSVVNNLTLENEFYGGANLGGGAVQFRGGTNHRIGGRIKGGDVGFTWISTNPVSDVVITTDIQVSVYAFNVANFGEGDPVIDWNTVDVSAANTHGTGNSFFISSNLTPRDFVARGAQVQSPPTTGSFKVGHTLRIPANDMGGPTRVTAVKDNTGGYPTWGVQERLLPAPADAASTIVEGNYTTSGGVSKLGNGRYQALARGTVISNGTADLAAGPVTVAVAAPYKGSRGVTLWMGPASTIGLDQVGVFGLSFDPVSGQAVATYNSGGPSLLYAYLGGYNYGRKFRMDVTRQNTGAYQVIWYRANEAGAMLQASSLVVSSPDQVLKLMMQMESSETAQLLQGL